MSTTDADLRAKDAPVDSDWPFLVDALKSMVSIRAVEQTALDLSLAIPPKILGSIHMCAGQEAVPVGTVAALGPDDQIVATYRGHGWALSSGLSPLEVFGEICHRRVGVNGGRGGSAYMMAPWGRFIGENSIVGAGVPIGCGTALANQMRDNGLVTVVSIGDGAFNQGSTHEGVAFAAARNLPLIVICENNGWSELTPTSLTFKVARIAQRASGYGIPGITADGTDPQVVRDTMRHAADHARRGGGPMIVEFRVPRLWGHYNRDIEHYRPKEDRQKASQQDPIALLSSRLLAWGMDGSELDRVLASVKLELDGVVQQVLGAPEADEGTARSHVYGSLNKRQEDAAPDPVESRDMTYIQAVNEALSRELAGRPEVIVYGEDVGQAGGIFGASRGLQRIYGTQRVFDTPISESAILGSALGAALCGMKPVIEIMWADFMLVALDQLINQAANVRYITGGRCAASIVVRTQQGATPGSCAQHSQSLEALLAHIPGIRVGLPSTPQDAYDMLRSAIASSDPCVLFEARGLYQTSGPVQLSQPVEPMGGAVLRKSGKDAAIVTWGTMTGPALSASKELEDSGLAVAVLDLRWLSPLDETALREVAVEAGGRVVVAHEANLTGGFGAEIVARLYEALGATLPLKMKRVGSPDIRMPAAPVLSRQLLPNAAHIVAAVRSIL